MVHISYFASCMTENDCSLLPYGGQAGGGEEGEVDMPMQPM